MARQLPIGIRVQGNRLQMRIKRPGRGWEWEATGLEPDEVKDAAELRTTTQAIIDSGQEPATYGRQTVDRYAKTWLADRRARGLLSVDDDEQRLRDHVLGVELGSGRRFGALFMDQVRPSICRAVVRKLRSKGLAPRTVLNVASLGRQLFVDAVADEVLERQVWVVPRKDLPRKADGDPEWRAGARLTLDEARALLFATDEVVPWDRRALYALEYLGAMRFGEAAARRWRDRRGGALHVYGSFSTARRAEGATKTAGARMMPEHPTLAAILDAWRVFGWERYFGRPPTDDDLIVPSRRGRNRSKNHSLVKLHEDLARLDLRPRRQHDLRRSFIGHAVDAGATRERLRPGTHGLGTSVLELYDTPEWESCREAVLKLRFEPPAELAALAAEAVGRMGREDQQTAVISMAAGGGAGRKPATFRGSTVTSRASVSAFDSRRLHQQPPGFRAVYDRKSPASPRPPHDGGGYEPPAIVLDVDFGEPSRPPRGGGVAARSSKGRR